jgi:hypothetical protein
MGSANSGGTGKRTAMSKLRNAFIAAMATAAVAPSFFGSLDSARAMPREEMRQARPIGHVNQPHSKHGDFRAHRYSGIAKGLAVGTGLAIISQAVAAEPKKRAGPVGRAKQETPAQLARDCEFVRSWRDLVEAGERILERDRELHKRWGENGHSISYVRSAEKELERRRAELRRAKERCYAAAAL